jgi:predicted transcriptional regulator
MLINFISQILTNATAIRAMKKERVEIFQDILLVRVIQDSLVMEHIACVAGLLNIGLQQSQGNLVFRGRERTQKSYWLKS